MRLREFEDHFRQLYMPLCMYALRLLGDVDEARDAVQECFTAMWDKLTTGRGDVDNFKAYIYMSVRNECVTRLRRSSPFSPLGDDMAETITHTEIDTSERDARLWEAIDRLPARCRQVFLLCKRDGLSYAEAAAEMGISIKTVEGQMTRALRDLRAALRTGALGKPFFLPFL